MSKVGGGSGLSDGCGLFMYRWTGDCNNWLGCGLIAFGLGFGWSDAVAMDYIWLLLISQAW